MRQQAGRGSRERLAIQRTFVERLRASGKETQSAEQTLEVMRDILRALYYSRSLLRRRVMTVNGAAASASSAWEARANRKMNLRKVERYGPSRRHRGDGGRNCPDGEFARTLRGNFAPPDDAISSGSPALL